MQDTLAIRGWGPGTFVPGMSNTSSVTSPKIYPPGGPVSTGFGDYLHGVKRSEEMICRLSRFPACAICPRSRVGAGLPVWPDCAGCSGRAEKFKVPAGTADSS